MPGKTNLEEILKTLQPQLNVGEYVFCTVPPSQTIVMDDVVMQFREAEGTTLILRKETADRIGLSYSFIAAWITLTVHSSLEAVGLTAAFSSALAAEGISCNVVAGYHHDHLFVNWKDAGRAMAVLSKLSAQIV